MTASYFEIRQCRNCGLRYPLVEGHPYGERCPVCLGDTRLVLSRSLPTEAGKDDMPRNHLSPTVSQPQGGKGHHLEALLDNIRSAWNVGSIFRTADGLGINKIYLCGITPTPENEAVTKTALGAQQTVAWEYSRNALERTEKLKVAGYTLIALEQDERAIPLTAVQRSIPKSQLSILVIGNEVTGVDPEILDRCDAILHIPMHGRKSSFNVEVAFAITAYQLTCG